jgi:hypothetical protein
MDTAASWVRCKKKKKKKEDNNNVWYLGGDLG